MVIEKIKIPVDQGRIEIAAVVERPESFKRSDVLVVIIPGSGPVDRDGNMRGMRANIYQQLAKLLTQSGFTTLRYDKIGVGESSGNFNRAGLEDAVGCVSDIIDYCRSADNIAFSKLVLLGHSEGTIIATLCASRKQADGIILLCGTGTSLKTVMTSQNEAVLSEIANKPGFSGKLLRLLVSPEKQRHKQRKLFDKVMQTDEATVRISGQIVQAKWLREHLAISDQEMIQQLCSLTCKVLAIEGSKDVQSPMKSFHDLNELNLAHMKMIVIKDMNHMLKTQKDACSLLALKKIYNKQLKEPITAELIHEIETWLQTIRPEE